MPEPKENAEQSKLAVGEMFHVIGTSTDERDGANKRDCSLPASAAPANITDLDVDMVCVTLLLVLPLPFSVYLALKYTACCFGFCIWFSIHVYNLI